MQIVEKVPVAERVLMKCVNVEDYRMFLIERGFFEQKILSQGALVVANEMLPVWLRHEQLPIHLMPAEIFPRAPYAKMTEITELEIIPPAESSTTQSSVVQEDRGKNTDGHDARMRRRRSAQATSEISEEVVDTGVERRKQLPTQTQERPLPQVEASRGRHEADLATGDQSKIRRRRSAPPIDGQKAGRRATMPALKKIEPEEYTVRLQRDPASDIFSSYIPVILNTHCEEKLAFLKPHPSEIAETYSTWFPACLSITTALSTVIFFSAASVEEMGLASGCYVSVSSARMTSSAQDKKTTMLRVFCGDFVARRHCVMAEEVASFLGIRYCERVTIKKVSPITVGLNSLCSISFQRVISNTSELEEEKLNRNGKKMNSINELKAGVADLADFLSDGLDLEVFETKDSCRAVVIQEGQQQERDPPVGNEESQSVSFLHVAQKTIERLIKPWFENSDGANEDAEDAKDCCTVNDILNTAEELTSFLRALFMAWADSQQTATWEMHRAFCRNNRGDSAALREHSFQSHVQKLCFPPNCLMHFNIKSETSSVVKKLILSLEFKAGNRLRESGVLVDRTDLWIAMRSPEFAILPRPPKFASSKSVEAFPQELSSLSAPPWLSTATEKCLQYARLALKLQRAQEDPFFGKSMGLLISGGRQSGKTSLVSGVCWTLAHDVNVLAHIHYISCRDLYSNMQENFSKFSAEKEKLYSVARSCGQSAPSIIVLDDIDCWCSSSEASESVNLTSKRAVYMIKDLMDQLRSRGFAVVFLATCTRLADVDDLLCETGFLDCHIQIPDLTSPVRGDMLNYLFLQKGVQLHPDALLDISRWDAGFEFADLERLCSRVVHCHLNSNSEDGIITKDDLQEALNDFKPAALWKVSKEEVKASLDHGLEDVGGMEYVKKVLHDCVELPIKFPDLMKQCPLRLMSNVLLYGPPGSGKTFIVNALRVSLGLRVVSVKGPELLNKYVGQSEAAVRSTFRSASEAAPCILFFDEFEALGRHRGSDTSGVSDRVVNQLLTEMDGVEDLTGVCVIAATSRPDLIDKALLRPGRLDRHVFCALPDAVQRHAILEILAKKQKIDPEVDLRHIAQATEGYSGADLTSIVAEAHLHAVGEYLKAHPDPTASPPSIVIGTEDVAFAECNLQRSRTDTEKKFLEEIYYNFSNGKVCKSRGNSGFRDKGLTFA